MNSEHRLLQRLWSEPDLSPWVVIDGAAVPGLPQRLSCLAWACLFQGDLAPDVAALAPYLVEVPRHGELLAWLASGWGSQWGVYMLAPRSMCMATLRRHLRKLGVAYGPVGEPLWFRWYDPRVLGLLAPGFDAVQLRTLFGPVRRFLLDSERSGHGMTLELTATGLAVGRF